MKVFLCVQWFMIDMLACGAVGYCCEVCDVAGDVWNACSGCCSCDCCENSCMYSMCEGVEECFVVDPVAGMHGCENK